MKEIILKRLNSIKWHAGIAIGLLVISILTDYLNTIDNRSALVMVLMVLLPQATKLLRDLASKHDVDTGVYQGFLDDTRSEEDKKKDYNYEEIVGASGISNLFRKVDSISEVKKYTPRNQSNSTSCVAQSIAKFLEVKDPSYIFSATPIFARRANKPGLGMSAPDAMEIIRKYGTTLESVTPSQNMLDPEMNNYVIPDNYEDLNNYTIPSNYLNLKIDFDKVAEAVQIEGAAIIFTDADFSLYNHDIPLPGGKKGGIRHATCVVDTINLKGQDYLVVEDSYGTWDTEEMRARRQRLFSRDFFNFACYYAGVLKDFKYDIVDHPFNLFTTNLEFGDSGEEVIRLQNFLKSKGYFPSNIASTGYYGSITAKAVLNFQKDHVKLPLINLINNKGYYFYELTREAVNKLI